MSILTLGTTPRRSTSVYSYALRLLEALSEVIQRRQAAYELQQLQQELDKLDDHDLRDIGIERHNIGAMVDVGMNRISLRSYR